MIAMAFHASAFDAVSDDRPAGTQEIKAMTTIVLEKGGETRARKRPRSARKPIEISNQLLKTEGLPLFVCRASKIPLSADPFTAMSPDTANDLLNDHLRRHGQYAMRLMN
jgi:hypothetical protein